MPGDFDMDAAVADIGDGLGFGEADAGADDGDEGITDVVAKEVPEVSEVAGEVKAPETSEPTPQVADDFPKTWRKEASAHWAALPSEVKAEVLKRESDIFQGLETYKVDANFGKSVKAVVAPYEQTLREGNLDPVRIIQGLMSSHHVLATGTPQQKAELFQRIAKDYRVDLSSLGVPAAGGEPPYVDPAVAALQTQLQAVQSQLSTAEQQRATQHRAEVTKQVDAFAADPKNIYWGDVADEMSQLLAKGVVGTLQEAYDKAVWLNPVTRMKEVTRTAAENSAKAAAEAKAKAEAAKSAMSVNVKTRVKTGSAATSGDSLDDTLAEGLSNIRARG